MSFLKPDPLSIVKAIDFVDSHFHDLLTVVVTKDSMETIIDTKDKVKLMELCNKKLLKYLFPTDNSVENEDAGFTQFRDVKAANFKLRTTAMFFEWEIIQARRCQIAFNETRYERPVHLIYYSILQDWIDFMEYSFNQYKQAAEAPEKADEASNKKSKPVTFIELFKKVSDYNAVMDILAKEGLVNKTSGVWVDTGGGKKSYLIAILTHLRELGYYKHDIKIEGKTFQDVCKNSFQIEVAIDTIKKTKTKDWPPSKLSIITPPSAIP